MRSSIPNDISFYSDVNHIFVNNIVNNQESFINSMNRQSLTQNNPGHQYNSFNNTNTTQLSVIQPFQNKHQQTFDSLNASLNNVNIFNESSIYLNTNTSKQYIKISFSINLIQNETNNVLQQISFNDTPIERDITSIMFLPICHKKLSENEYSDISLFKFVLITNNGLFLKILNDLDPICTYIRLHYEKKVRLCLYSIEMDILMQLNETKKLISINYSKKSLQGSDDCDDRNCPVLISNSKLYSCPKSKCLKAIKQLIDKYNSSEEINVIYTIKWFGNTIKEAIEKKTIEIEEIDGKSCYDMLQKMKIVRFIVK